VSPVFAQRIDGCLSYIADRLAQPLDEARSAGELPSSTDPQALATRLVDCWEGAALRSRLSRDPAPLREMLDFFFDAATRE
jgi:TetR/AcrR family transcriptional repressor of nem operon